MTLPLAKDAKIVKGVFDKEAKTFKAGDPIEKAAYTEMIEKSEGKGVGAFIVTDADNKNITEIASPAEEEEED